MIAISNKVSRFIYSLFIVCVYLFMSSIPLFLINSDMIDGSFAHKGVMASFNLMTGGSIQRLSILGLSLTPYVIVQMGVRLLKNAFDTFKESDKDPLKRQQLMRITRWLTLVVAIGFAVNLVFFQLQDYANLINTSSFWAKLLAVIHLVYGSIITMWFTERINHAGIGNGFGVILLFSLMSSGVGSIYAYVNSIKLAEEWFGLVQVAGMVIIFNIALLLLVYILFAFFNRKKARYLSPAIVVLLLLLYLYLRDNVIIQLPLAMKMILAIGCIFSFFMIIILYCEAILYQIMICLTKQDYSSDIPPDTFPTKMNPGGITPVIAAENSMAFIEGGLRLLFYTGILDLLNFELDNFRIRIFKIIWKSALMFLISFWWTEIELEPTDIAQTMKSRAIFPGIAEGNYTKLYIERFIKMLALTGGFYLLTVVTLPDLINLFLFEADIYSHLVFNGTSVILLVSCASELCNRLILSPAGQVGAANLLR